LYLLSWRLDPETHQQPSSSFSSFVLKTLRLFQTFDYDHHQFGGAKPIIMERLTASPIVDIYGHCGTSLAVEYVQM
jgi:hypothetical protein